MLGALVFLFHFREEGFDLPVEILLELGEGESLNVDKRGFWRTCGLRRCVVGEVVVDGFRAGVDVVEVLQLFVESGLGGLELFFVIAEFGLARRRH